MNELIKTARLSMRILSLRLHRTFTTAKTAAASKETLIVQWREGIGEGSPSLHYGSGAATLQQALNSRLAAEPVINESDLERLIGSLPIDLAVLRCALEMALLDHQARAAGLPLHTYLELPAPTPVETSFTITSGSRDEIMRQLDAAQEFTILKLKVGFAGDLGFIDTVLSVRERRLRLDANGGWSLSEAIGTIKSLAGYPIDFYEQPLTDPALRDLYDIKDRTGARIVLDESVQVREDLERLAPAIDGVNLKLAKCGGIRNTIALAQRGRELGLKLLLGCMIESAVSVTAALHLASLFDYFDLDAIALTENDPFWGAAIAHGRLLLPRGAGLAITTEEHLGA